MYVGVYIDYFCFCPLLVDKTLNSPVYSIEYFSCFRISLIFGFLLDTFNDATIYFHDGLDFNIEYVYYLLLKRTYIFRSFYCSASIFNIFSEFCKIFIRLASIISINSLIFASICTSCSFIGSVADSVRL